MAEYFHVRNPTHLGGGISTVQIPFQRKFGVEMSGGPIKDMCYILFDRDKSVKKDAAVENPTPHRHAGWKMVGEGIFKGWEDPSEGESKSNAQRMEWHPILHARENTKNRILKTMDERDLIKFKRTYRTIYNLHDPDAPGREETTDKIATYLCWIECEWYIHPITVKQGNAKLRTLSKTTEEGKQDMGDLGLLPKVLQSKILATNLSKNITPPTATIINT